MLETFLKTNFVGKDGYFWWIGQIVEQKYWEQNIAPYPTDKEEEFGGFDYRYKVRIMGYHTDDRNDLSDEELPWASVMFPVTAGAGSGGAHQSPNLRQGNFVYGFFMDGEDAQHPIITGVFGYNQYKKLERNDPIDAYTPYSGYNSKMDLIAYYTVSPDKSFISGLTDEMLIENAVGFDQFPSSSDLTAYSLEKVPQPIAQDIGCDQTKDKSIQTILQNGLAKKQKLEKSKSSWLTKMSTRVADVENKLDEISGGLDAFDTAIEKAMNDMQEGITGQMKTVTDNIERGVTKSINEAMASAYSQVFPGALPDLKKKADKANNDLSCAFRNIGANLFKMVGGFLNQAINKLINAPLCAINNFIGSMIGKISGIIDGAVGAILGPIKSLLSSLGGATNLLDNITTAASGALSFLSCGQTPSCSDVESWSQSEGIVAPNIAATLDLPNIISQAKGIASGVKESINSFKDIGSTIKGVVDGADFSNVIGDAVSSCNVGPLRCGPPTIEFFGGGGSGAAGNAIIGAAGTLLGVDVILPGSGYTDVPFISFKDSCGKGGGATARAVISNGEVVQVIMNDTGTDYLPTPDGSQGGDGRTWAESNETTVKKADGTYETPYQPGTVITVCPGDEVTEPGGNVVFIGGEDCTEITAKEAADTPISDTGEYPVSLSIDFVNVVNMGFGYDCSKDTVVVEPNNGAKLSIGKCDSTGSILKIDVIDGGTGFENDPDIYIQSDSGYNVKLVPTFKVNRLDVDAVGVVDAAAVPSTGIVQVIDCVGKF